MVFRRDDNRFENFYLILDQYFEKIYFSYEPLAAIKRTQ